MVSSTTANSVITWNEDFLLASQWQLSTQSATTRGSEFCDIQKFTLTGADAATSSRVFSEIAGLTGKTKCSHQVIVAATKGAPGVALDTTALWTKYQFQWVEWDSEAMTGNMILNTSSSTPAFLGAYSGQWPNPMKTWTVAGVSSALQASAVVPITSNAAMPFPGSIGDINFYPSEAGPYKYTNLQTWDYGQLKMEYDAYNVVKSAYNTRLLAYNKLKDEYNLALKEEKARVADLFRAAITPPTSIPDRPCKPDHIAAYTGPKMVWSTATTAFSAWTDTTKAEKSAILKENSSVDNVIGSFKSGYIQTSTDTSITQTAALIQNVYHTYGLLGQGASTDPAATTTRAFQWKAATATATH